MNTLENNKLIADFLGLETIVGTSIVSVVQHNQLKVFNPNNDWNWLMEVVEKISEIVHNYHDNMFEGSNELENFYDLGLEHIKFSEDELTVGTTKEFLYEDVVTFVNWFNLQNS